MTSFGFCEENTEPVGVIDVALQSDHALVPESNAVVVVVTALAAVTAVVVVAMDLAGSGW